MRLKKIHTGSSDTNANVTETVINVTRDGDWLPGDELRAVAILAAKADSNLTVNLQGVDHLDASALQILLALAAEQNRRDRGLRLANASIPLSRWFEYAGGRESISPEREA